MLSTRAQSVWAKSQCTKDGRLSEWLSLHQHLDDAAAVAPLLVRDWLPTQVIRRISAELPGGEPDLPILLGWLAAVHDVGKASPAFAVQVDVLADHMRNHGLGMNPRMRVDPSRSQVRHERVGHLLVQQWLVDRFDFDYTGAAALAVIVGGHHGVPPESGQLSEVEARHSFRGTGTWEQVQQELLDRAGRRPRVTDVLRGLVGVRLSQPVQVLLTAVVIVADWIASNDDLFPLEPIEELDDDRALLSDEAAHAATGRRIAAAWRALDLPPRWQPSGRAGGIDEMFAARFQLAGARVRPVQAAAVAIATEQAGAGLLIVEAPMGEGKTEAALLVAEVIASKSGAGGVFVALPTQATTDAMFGRFASWLSALPSLPDERRVIYLAHGKATLNDEYQGMVRAGWFRSIGLDEELGRDDAAGDVAAHQWLSGRKKGVLAPFVVGTIDQGLFLALKSRHVVIRHLALAGKVVVIDEVHSYDVYMSQYLDRMLQWLAAYGVPVIMLSATLPPVRRDQLVRAYAERLGVEVTSSGSPTTGYPAITSLAGTGVITSAEVPASGRSTEVHVDHLADDLDALAGYLREHLATGGCAVVVRNTVTRVQDAADRLEQEFGREAIIVTHARFLACDRAKTARELLRQFGPPGERNQRPALRIVVASQVVEQSLDVDFDLMVTDLAPVDLVLQRMGRLHRHHRTDRPASVTAARCALVGVQDWHSAPVVAVAGSRRVYDPYTLLRSAALLNPEREAVRLPDDIPKLVQSAYGDEQLGPRSWQSHLAKAKVESERAAVKRSAEADKYRLDPVRDRGESLVGWLRAGVGDADDSSNGAAQVRDGGDSLEVLVVQRDADGGLLIPDWIEEHAGAQLPTDEQVPAALARTVAACALRLPPALCHGGIVDCTIAALERNQHTSFQQTPLLKGQLVLELDHERSTDLELGSTTFRLTYDVRRGLIHERC